MTARLIVADSERDANLLYATGMFVPDPFIWFECRGRTYAVLSDLEIDRARQHARVDRVLAYAQYHKKLERDGARRPRLSEVLREVLREFRVHTVQVPAGFPLGLARKLRGVRVVVAEDPFFAGREHKRADEVRQIARAVGLAEEGMKAAVNLIRRSRIGPGGFLYQSRGVKLRSETIQGAANAAIARAGGVASYTIAAAGNQACDPHETGHGPVRAHQPIILDIFPRDTATGYCGDITRTVVRGRASDRVKEMYAAVQDGQKLVFERLRDGAGAQEVHLAVVELFRKRGFPTGRRRGRMQGFFHGTGHGLGLEVHEAPRICQQNGILRTGHVLTVEPGLYYWGIGGVRLEDVAVIQLRGARNLTRFPKQLEV